MISLQVKYSPQSFLTGDVIAARSSGFQYSQGDCLSEWLNSGHNADAWKASFAIIYLSDCDDIGNAALKKLIEVYSDDPDAQYKRKYFIQIPADENNKHRISIRNTGETVATLSEIIALTAER